MKLATGTEHLPALIRLLETRAGGPGRESRLVATYFDTPDRALARQGLTLRVREEAGRVREEAGRFVQTVKSASGDGTGSGAALARGEWEDQVAGGSPDPHAPQTGRFIPAGAAQALRALVRTDIARHSFMLCPDPQTRIEAAVDRGRLASVPGDAGEPVCEIELELKAGEVAALYDVALDLLAVAPVRLERRSKSARGFRLANLSDLPERAPEPVAAVHASAVALDPDMTAGAALRRIVRSCADQIVGNEAAVLAGMPEGVHQMRVGVRRLRAILSAFAPLLKPDFANSEAGRFSDELRWLGNGLGRARNLDVFADGLVARAVGSIGDVPGISALNAACAERRAAARAEAAAAIRSPRYTALVLRLMRWSEQSGAADHAAAALSRPLAKIAPKLLKRRVKLVRRRSAGFATQSPERRHRLRIALKKLRYAMEMLGPLCDAKKPAKKKTARLLRAVKRLQEKLGDANDLRVSRDLVGEIANGAADRKAIAASGNTVLDWHERRLRSGERKTRKILATLRDKLSSW